MYQISTHFFACLCLFYFIIRYYVTLYIALVMYYKQSLVLQQYHSCFSLLGMMNLILLHQYIFQQKNQLFKRYIDSFWLLHLMEHNKLSKSFAMRGLSLLIAFCYHFYFFLLFQISRLQRSAFPRKVKHGNRRLSCWRQCY